MGFVRGALLILVCILLFLSLFLTGIFATLNASLKYESVKPQVSQIIGSIVNKSEGQTSIQQQSLINKSCANNSQYFSRDSELNYTFEIPCNIAVQGRESIINYETGVLIEDEYYRERTCGFWECFKEEEMPFFLVSEYARDYWKARYYFFLIVSIILAVLLFLLIENKTSFPIVLGVLVGLSFLPISVLDSIGKSAVEFVLSFFKYAVDNLIAVDLNLIVSIFFSKANFVFLTGFIIGLVLIGLGILMKIFKIGFEIGEWFYKKESDEKASGKAAVKKEVKSEAKETKKPKKVFRNKDGGVF